MRLRLSLVTLLALVLAIPAHAQGAKDSALVRGNKIDLDSIARDKTAPAYSKRAQARIRARDSLFLVRTVTPPPVTQPPVVQPPVVVADSTPTQPTPPAPTPTPAPVPSPVPTSVIFSHPFAPPSNGAVLAELPRDTVDVSYPAITRRILVTSLQAAIDTAKTGDELLLAPGSTYANVVANATNRVGWIVIRANVADSLLGGQWTRMTKTRADALNLPTITTNSNTPALWILSNAHHIRVVGVKIEARGDGNALVWIGNNETTASAIPHHIVLDRIVADGGPYDIRRCEREDGNYDAVVSSSLLNCHSNQSDSQGWLKINGSVSRVENNTIQGGHQSVFLGGADPNIRGSLPSDIVIRRNDLSRPASWWCTPNGTSTRICNAGQWRGKTDAEIKIGERELIEGNVMCHTIADAQAGFAALFKTENQDGGTSGDWSHSGDITFRYNRICGASAGINLSGLAAGPGVPMARVAIYGNELDSISVGPYTSDTGDCLLMQGVADVVYQDNWCRNPSGRSAIYASGTVNPRFVGLRNTFGGQYGIRGSTSVEFPSGLLSGNTLVDFGTAFSAWPASPVTAARDALLVGVQVAP